jgi:hypothetical protein
MSTKSETRIATLGARRMTLGLPKAEEVKRDALLTGNIRRVSREWGKVA